MQRSNPESKKITKVVVMGDSLSDRGTLNHSKLLGFIPMRIITFFAAKTHHDRFTNAYTWDDDFGASLVAQLVLQDLRTRPDSRVLAQLPQPNSSSVPNGKAEADENADLADMIESGRGEQYLQAHDAIDLRDDKRIPFYCSEDYVRTYCEGGLTAHDWKKDAVDGVAEEGSRMILTTLANKRKELLADDRKARRDDAEKAATLVVEWSGGNDLITVNKKPTRAEADAAVQARMDNVRQLINNGYRNFVLFELPDLSLTPRFQQGESEEAAEQALEVVEYFNNQLRTQCLNLLHDMQHQGLDISLHVFGINSILRKVHSNPGQYGFTNTTEPFVKSDYYKNRDKAPDAPLSSHGYMFWDDIHPTGHMHAILAEEFYARCQGKYEFDLPLQALESSKDLFEVFMMHYDHKLYMDVNGFFGCARHERLRAAFRSSFLTQDSQNMDYDMALAKILHHAISEKGYRSRGVLRNLGWIDRHGNINTDIPGLLRAKHTIELGLHTSILHSQPRY